MSYGRVPKVTIECVRVDESVRRRVELHPSLASQISFSDPEPTVTINNAKNAGLLAARIIATSIPSLTAKSRHTLEKGVMGKVGRLEEDGWEDYVVKK